MSIPALALLLFLTPDLPASEASAPADGWPQYHGPDHDRACAGRIPAAALAGAEDREQWRVPTDAGFSSFAVAGDRAYTLVSREVGDDRREVCVALSADTGRELWDAALGPAEYDRGGDSGAEGNEGGDGPRSTPTVHGESVLVLDASLVLHCLDSANGAMRWRHDLVEEHAGRNVKWGNAASPVVDGGLVFVAGGGEGQSFLAFDAATGELAWKTGDERMTHATPAVATLHDVRQVIFFVQSGLVALEARTGRELWRAEYPFRTSTAASPVVHGELVYCSAGYGVGAGAFRVSKGEKGFTAENVWHRRNELMNHWSTPVCKDGFLYGMFGFKEYGEAPLACVELATGEERWSAPGFGPGNCILVGDELVALSDTGEVVLVTATPDGYRELARADVLEGKCWSSPAFADGRLYVRSTDEGVCLDLTTAER